MLNTSYKNLVLIVNHPLLLIDTFIYKCTKKLNDSRLPRMDYDLFDFLLVT